MEEIKRINKAIDELEERKTNVIITNIHSDPEFIKDEIKMLSDENVKKIADYYGIENNLDSVLAKVDCVFADWTREYVFSELINMSIDELRRIAGVNNGNKLELIGNIMRDELMKKEIHELVFYAYERNISVLGNKKDLTEKIIRNGMMLSTKDDLKQVLKQYNIVTTGNKDELVGRIIGLEPVEEIDLSTEKCYFCDHEGSYSLTEEELHNICESCYYKKGDMCDEVFMKEMEIAVSDCEQDLYTMSVKLLRELTRSSGFKENLINKFTDNIWNRFVGKETETSLCPNCSSNFISRKHYIAEYIDISKELTEDNILPVCIECHKSNKGKNYTKFMDKSLFKKIASLFGF